MDSKARPRASMFILWSTSHGPISGVQSDCDLVIWIKTREAAASGLMFFRSANEVILTGDTIAPNFFHSAQIMQSCEALPATDGPPHPQQVALAISGAPLQASASRGRDAQHNRQHMLLVILQAYTLPDQGDADDPGPQVAVASARSPMQSWSFLHISSPMYCAVLTRSALTSHCATHVRTSYSTKYWVR